VETKPQLEIYADDVKCTHGATIGQLVEEAIFYFLARGIPRAKAQRLWVFAFVYEIFERMELAPVRERLQTLVAARLRDRVRRPARFPTSTFAGFGPSFPFFHGKSARTIWTTSTRQRRPRSLRSSSTRSVRSTNSTTRTCTAACTG
jgi:hypothetical protein